MDSDAWPECANTFNAKNTKGILKKQNIISVMSIISNNLYKLLSRDV